MQLFITDFQIEGENIIILEDRVVSQLTKVLRISVGYEFLVQNGITDNILTRYKIGVTDFSKTFIKCKIISTEKIKINDLNFGIICSMLNKFEKIETIVQKLSEIGVPNIIFYPSERSVIKEVSSNKMERLNKISLEAVEQSKGLFLPEINFIGDIDSFLDGKRVAIFDGEGESLLGIGSMENIYGIIGPEGGFSQKDFTVLEKYLYKKVNLGQTILRAETAAIIAGWLLKNI